MMQRTINIVLTKPLGDMLCTLPAVRWAVENTPWVDKFYIVTPDNFVQVVEVLLQPWKDRLEVVSYTRAIEELTGLPAHKWDSLHSTGMRKHLTHHAFQTVIDVSVPEGVRADGSDHCSPVMFERDWSPQVPFTGVPLERCVVVQGAAKAVNKGLSSEGARELMEAILDRGEIPLVVGQTTKSKSVFNSTAIFATDIPDGAIDLINKLSLYDVAALLKYVGRYIGIDGGLTHLAASIPDCKIVSGYTLAAPEHAAPKISSERFKIVIPSDPKFCGHCQSKYHLMHGVNFTKGFHESGLCAKDVHKDLIKALDFLI